jgi:beta-mannosidase
MRKASSMYGWDIMPRLITAGLWRDVNLEIRKKNRIGQVFWQTNAVDVEKKTAQVLVDWQIYSDYPTIDGLNMEISLTRNGKSVYEKTYPLYTYAKRREINLENVDFWWPRGYGDAALYNATLRLVDDKGNVLDENSQRVGIRTIKLVRSEAITEDNPGEFVFVVNGEKIFVKGTNWVPLDAFHSRDWFHVKPAMDMIIDLNCNMIRCWGGNVYEDHPFFDSCDENGIMVWQDFSFAGTPYSQDPEFLEEIRKEANNIVIKLRIHPSLALWCGNNEIDYYFIKLYNKAINPKYDKISREILPTAVWEYDPLRDYLPSSPYISDECFKYQQNGLNYDAMPQVHLWGIRGYYKTPFYTDQKAHFVSEIGYHGCPNRESIEKMFDPDYVYPWTNNWEWNDEWQTKAARPHPASTGYDERNDLMINQVKILFGECPKDLDKFIFGSQVVQAEAMKYFVELWRMDKFNKTGIIWWNLRDGWPIISDAIVDYYNSKKLAYDYIKQVQYNACVMVGDAKGGKHPVVAVNDTRETKSGKVTVRNIDSKKVLFTSSFNIPVNGKIVIGNIPEITGQTMWLIEYTIDDKEYKNHYLVGKAPFKMDDYQRWYKNLIR